MVAIFVAFMFVSLVLTDLGVEKWKAWRTAYALQAARSAAAAMAIDRDAWCRVPDGVHLGSQHTWVKSDPAGGLEIGADALVARAVGAACRIILPKQGEMVTAGQPLFRLENKGGTVTIPAAITGRIVEVNTRLDGQPELVSQDPYGSGWVCHLTPTRAEGTASDWRFGEQAVIWLEKEFGRFQEFLFGQVSPDLALGLTSQDGGFPAAGCLLELGSQACEAFEASFLRRPEGIS